MTFTKRFTPIPLKDTALFQPIRVGTMDLQHRVVLAPLTRLRNINNVPTDIMMEYYRQRSTRPGTFIVTEATQISERVAASSSAPGIWSREQLDRWKEIHAIIHANKSFVFQQLWAAGRQANPVYLKQHEHKFVAPSEIYSSDESKKKALDAGNPLHALTKQEIKTYVEEFVVAAKNAIDAGADGIEVHGANGYLPDEFLDPGCNVRDDEYGGSIENRSRFILEVMDALIDAIGPERCALRLSPLGVYGNMSGESNPLWMAQFSHVVGELERRARAGKRLAYIHLMEPRNDTQRISDSVDAVDSTCDFIYGAWKGVVIRCGDYGINPELAVEQAGLGKTLIAYGRWFISNPDLPDRLYHGYPLDEYDRNTFYTAGPEGYIDAPTYDVSLKMQY